MACNTQTSKSINVNLITKHIRIRSINKIKSLKAEINIRNQIIKLYGNCPAVFVFKDMPHINKIY